jgi:hypothetical protein
MQPVWLHFVVWDGGGGGGGEGFLLCLWLDGTVILKLTHVLSLHFIFDHLH